MATLFLISKSWKQPRGPAVGETLVHSAKGILFGTKSTGLSSHENTLRNLNAWYKVKEGSVKSRHTV